MGYYTIQNDNLLIGQTEQALTRYYDKVYPLPEDYEPNKYIVGEVEEEIDEPDYDEEGNIIYIDGEAYVNDEGINIIPKIPSTHKETVTVKKLVLNPNYEEEKAAAERKRLDLLSLTKREVFLALYKSKGITPEQLRAQITDIEAQIEFDYAEKYYRGNPLINSIGAMLGYTTEQLDCLFKYKSFTPPPEPEPTEDLTETII